MTLESGEGTLSLVLGILILLLGPLAVSLLVRGIGFFVEARREDRTQRLRLFGQDGLGPNRMRTRSRGAERLESLRSVRSLATKLTQAGLEMPVVVFLGFMTMAIAVMFVFLWTTLGISVIVNMALSTGIVWAGVSLFLSSRKDSYLKQLAAQMPQVAMLMANSLRAGLSVDQAIRLVATRLGPPAGREFERVAREVQLGEPVELALGRLEERFGLEELKVIVATIRVERQVGGDLAKALGLMSSSIIDRQRVHNEIDAVMAEGRITGIAMLVIPFLMLLLVNQTQPGVVRDFLATPFGWIITAIFAGVQVLSFRLLDTFSRIEV